MIAETLVVINNNTQMADVAIFTMLGPLGDSKGMYLMQYKQSKNVAHPLNENSSSLLIFLNNILFANYIPEFFVDNLNDDDL